MNTDILHVVDVNVVRDFNLKVQFNDGTRKVVDVAPLLTGPVFEPLRDPGFFAKVVIDPVSQTVIWPNGADLAPEALYQLAALEHVA